MKMNSPINLGKQHNVKNKSKESGKQKRIRSAEPESVKINMIFAAFQNEKLVFGIGLVIFAVAAFLGWEKLHYGFNFLDEGYYMTEAWRISAGDALFNDKIRGALDLSPIINSIFFRISPDITLLNFRQIQFLLTLCALAVFSVALFKVHKEYWFYPLIFSLFAFTGVETTGTIPNLSKNTYPHLFIIFHLAFLLFGFHQKSARLRRVLFALSGFFLWLISFTLLTMSVVFLSPFIVYYFFRKWKTDFITFEFIDLCFVYAPVIFCWASFLIVFNIEYLNKIIPCIHLNQQWSGYYKGEALFHRIINWDTAKYLTVNIVAILTYFYLLRYRKAVFLLGGLILCFLMYFIINTSFWGLIHPAINLPFYSRPMWLASLLLSTYLIFPLLILWKIKNRRKLSEAEVISIILLTPCVILSVSNSILTVNGIIALLWASTPTVAAISMLLLSNRNVEKQPYLIKLLVLVIFFLPFYYSTAWSGWHYPYGDVSHEYANATIEYGFGKGIKTNLYYKNLHDWIRKNAEKYTSKNDFIISYTCSPMVYIIAKRKPAFDSSWLDAQDAPRDYIEMAVNYMKSNGRQPRMSFIFESMPMILQLTGDRYTWCPRQFDFNHYNDDPILQYISSNMSPLDQLDMGEGIKMRCLYKLQ